MTDDEQLLLADIRANPKDDQPRKVYADLLLARADIRGEYMSIAVDMPWDDAKRKRFEKLKRKEKQFAAKLGLTGLNLSWFRGLPNSVSATVEQVLQHGDALSRLPIESLYLIDGVQDLAKLVELPLLSTVETLSLGQATSSNVAPFRPVPIARDDMAALCASPHLKALRHVSFKESLSDESAALLGAAPWLAHVEDLTIYDWTHGGIRGESLARVLARELPSLRSVSLTGLSLGEPGGRALGDAVLPALESLTISRSKLGAGAGAAHVLSRVTSLRSLYISEDDLRDAIVGLDLAPTRTLRALQLPKCHLGDAGAAALASSQAFLELESLVLTGNELTLEGVVALANATGMPKLTELHVSDNRLLTGRQTYVESPEDSEGVSGYYDERIPPDEIRALFAHRPGLRVWS